jgi:hypothetical protein
MQEVMMKAKLYRLEKLKEKEQQATLVHDLDAEFRDIRKHLEFKGAGEDKAHTGSSLDDLLAQMEKEKKTAGGKKRKSANGAEEDFDSDALVAQLLKAHRDQKDGESEDKVVESKEDEMDEFARLGIPLRACVCVHKFVLSPCFDIVHTSFCFFFSNVS